MMSDPSRRAVILGGARTPFAKLSGALATQSAVDLGVVAARAAIERAGISPTDVDNTIFGQVLPGRLQDRTQPVRLRCERASASRYLLKRSTVSAGRGCARSH